MHALQRGRNIFVCEISFHRPELSQLEHQYPMPKVQGPGALLTRDELVQSILRDPKVTPEIGNAIRFHIFEPFDLEIRFLEEISVKTITEAKPMEPRQAFWIRVGHKLPDDFSLHQVLYLTERSKSSHGMVWYLVHSGICDRSLVVECIAETKGSSHVESANNIHGHYRPLHLVSFAI